MNTFHPVCHGEERSDAAIHPDVRWIATPDFVGLAMTNLSVTLPR
ncbi:MAG TPA: hypothetical protein VMM36_01255 [Opitutaceae bacterium]|nr:hypothetical protein [Opitutaceae bacterium]